MKCSLCGHVFDEKSAAAACARCPIARGCNLARCPNCGFEMPVDPGWIRWLRGMKKEETHEDKQ